ncbi:type II toxin-antitoxin system PemK/MazF family toxin [Candidatus Pacearchaeota archaeon]|nr:type II toxin-antitoxin system PemK/MazF family toxin [Candidatus Pacearchaeota archaeon]
MEIKRGDILLVNFEPVKGSEQGKIRPALVIQSNNLNKFSSLTIVAPITSKIYEKEYPTNVLLNKGTSGLKNDSTILLNQIRALDKRRVIKKIGSADQFTMLKTDISIKICLGLTNLD